MKRALVALSIMGLVCGLALSAAAQTPKVLWQPDLTKDKLEPPTGATIYRQGVNGDGDQTSDTTPASGGSTQVAPFQIVTDNTDPRFQWLDGGDSTNVGLGDGYDDTQPVDSGGTAPWMLLTGDPAWADVSISTKAIMWNQNTGALMLILRAAPKTKADDPDSYYELQLTTGNSNVLASMDRDGITQPNDTSTNDDGSSEGATLRILKRVNGKWTQLAEVNQDKTSVHIPRINNVGHDHDVNHGQGDPTSDALTGGFFRFVAKGTTLTGSVSLDGKTFTDVITATDGDLKAGLVGFSSYDIEPVFKDIQVTEAP